MGEELLVTLIVAFIILAMLKFSGYGKERGGYDRNGNGTYDKDGLGRRIDGPLEKKRKWFSLFKSSGVRVKRGQHTSDTRYSCLFNYDREAIKWCADFFGFSRTEFEKVLMHIPEHYRSFRLGKRSGGFRVISAPEGQLLVLQRQIYSRILQKVQLHPVATGFRSGMSIVDNVRPHLGSKQILKTDLKDFFGSIPQYRVRKAFEQLGYPANVSAVLAQLCCHRKCLPQGAPTSPALSNLIATRMDERLEGLARRYRLKYTRYADDLTFSGDFIPREDFLSKLYTVVLKEGFALSVKKTRFIGENRRKIITGISVSSGIKMTIPKTMKREIRKNVYFVLTKGVAEHQRAIGSTHPAYLKTLLGQLSYWLSVEPGNPYVLNALRALKKLQKS